MKSTALIVAMIALACLAFSAKAESPADVSSCTKINSKLDQNGCITCCRKFGKTISSMAVFSSRCACSQEAVRTKQFKVL